MLKPFWEIPPEDRIIVALDCSADEALELGKKLRGAAKWVKVGMTLFYREGPSIVSKLRDMDFNVFLDLKFHDIPHQVQGAARSAALSGASMLTMHGLGGADMMAAGVEGAREGAAAAGLDDPIVLAITVLTSTNQEMMDAIGITRSIPEEVTTLAALSKEAGASGVVCSPQEARQMRELLGAESYIVTPGVRPAGASVDDQKRIATPAAAFEAGASHLVIGRPITMAPDPREAFSAISLEVNSKQLRP